jgi:alkyldihydroxyacetonephosphate synthase
VYTFRGSGEVQAFRQSHEIAQVPEFHVVSREIDQSIWSMIFSIINHCCLSSISRQIRISSAAIAAINDSTRRFDMEERRRKFYGWGYEGDTVSSAEIAEFEAAWSRMLGVDRFEATPFPKEEDIALRAPRIRVPASLAAICTTDKYDRLYHTYGAGTMDVARALRGEFSSPPDVIAYPRTEEDIVDLYDWCGRHNLAAIPYGGGTSVVGGVNVPEYDRYRGAVTIDLKHFDKVLEVDTRSQSARIQAGVLGPSLEKQLKPSGLTMRFFLQAWEFSSLGGWIATRAAGHFATAYTQIDDHVQSLKVVTPSGNVESRRFPVSGAGPNPDRLFLGSEGALGIITEAWVRLHRRPVFRKMTTVRFAVFENAVEATRLLAQSGLNPANARLSVAVCEAAAEGLRSAPAR